MFERFTDRARRVLVLAQDEAHHLRHDHIGTEHLLLALAREGGGLAARVLQSRGISAGAVRAKLEAAGASPAEPRPASSIPFTAEAKRALEGALREALQLNHNSIGTEHLLIAIAREDGSPGARLLVDLGADLAGVREQVVQLLAEAREGRDEPPLCSHCRASLTITAVHRTMDVPAREGAEPPVRALVVYCQACGTAVAAGPAAPRAGGPVA